jgi:hypothetical protein
MENLENITRQGKWTSSVDQINTNFGKIEENLIGLEKNSTRSKGLYSSLQELNIAFPSAEIGSWAYVGSGFPATIYIYNNGWINTGKTGDLDTEIDFTELVNSSTVMVSSLYKTTMTWSYNNSMGWNTYNNGIPVSGKTYTIRPTSLTFGEEGQLLRPTSGDSDLYEFKPGASLVSVVIVGNGGTRKIVTVSLSWTIDSNIIGRVPIAGDQFVVYFRYKNLEGDTRAIVQHFKFIS